MLEVAKSDPARAAGLSTVVLPLVEILTKIGNEAISAIATLGDEILRQRDPEVFRALSAMIFELKRYRLKTL